MAARSKYVALLRGFGGPQLKKDIAKALYASADDVRARSRRSITAGSISGANHVPSAPGQPPNNDTGTLIASHEVRMVSWNRSRVSVTAPYAAALEFGTSRMAARPFLGVATRDSEDQFSRRVETAIKQAARRAEAMAKVS